MTNQVKWIINRGPRATPGARRASSDVSARAVVVVLFEVVEQARSGRLPSEQLPGLSAGHGDVEGGEVGQGVLSLRTARVSARGVLYVSQLSTGHLYC